MDEQQRHEACAGVEYQARARQPFALGGEIKPPEIAEIIVPDSLAIARASTFSSATGPASNDPRGCGRARDRIRRTRTSGMNPDCD